MVNLLEARHEMNEGNLSLVEPLKAENSVTDQLNQVVERRVDVAENTIDFDAANSTLKFFRI